MDYEPQLIFRKPAIADDLARAAAWCRHIHRSTPAYTLVAVAFLAEGKAIVLDPRLAEQDIHFDEAHVMQTAASALKSLGYPTSLIGYSWSSPGTIVFEACLSAHQRLTAIKDFQDAGLSRLG